MAGVVDIATDGDGDLKMEAGDFVLIDGSEACAQLIKIALLTIFGELIWNKNKGNRLLAAEDSPTPAEVKIECKRIIEEVPGVKNVGTLTVEIDAVERVANVSGEAFYDDGTLIPISTVVPFGG